MIDILSQITDRYESDGGSVREVDATVSGRHDGPSATIDVVVPPRGSGPRTDAAPEAARLEDDGTLRLEFPASALPAMEEYAPDGVAVAADGVRVTDDGDVVATFAVGFEDGAPTASETVPSSGLATADAGSEVGSEADSETDLDPEVARALESARDEDLPPYEDVAYLEELYESFDTFAEMAAVLEMDVAVETVRRYMIDAGVHDPVSYDVDAADERTDATATGTDRPSASAGDPESDPSREPDEAADPIERLSTERLAADGLGLPEGVDLEDLIEAVESAMTLRDVCRRLELEREPARELLAQLDLLDLVVRRVYASSEPEAGPSRETIAERIRGSADRPQTRSERRGDPRPALS
ncbi:hypothetical protein C492_15546 [Natronococcus jeotgali DSM 18795]|uniref:Uncharacterized protein n=1 Tax=Natronococcus jeotgali DSM 18795 TaxID=1227498 RepID=L9X263_9EURY|nr:hypothetical protein C492_15546 [Natronococcus jeotgali DSM 18795]